MLPHCLFWHAVSTVPILNISWMDYNHRQISLRINQDVPFAASNSFPLSKPRSPPASVVFTLWLSMIPHSPPGFAQPSSTLALEEHH